MQGTLARAAVAVSGLNFRNDRGAIVVNNIGDVTVSGGTFTGNAATDGGAIADNSALSGDPRSELGSVNLKDSEVTGNHAGAAGGGIYNDGGEVDAAGTRIAVNTAAAAGGIADHGTVTVKLTGATVIKNMPDNCEPAGSITGCSS